MRARSFIAGISSAALAAAGAVVALAPPASGGLTGNEVFTVVGTEEFVVPAQICQITMTAIGGAGGDAYEGSGAGGFGGNIEGTFSVTPGETLTVHVAGRGEDGVSAGNAAGGSGLDAGGFGNRGGGGGGGSSAVVAGDGTVLIVAAGGGGGYGDLEGGNGASSVPDFSFGGDGANGESSPATGGTAGNPQTNHTEGGSSSGDSGGGGAGSAGGGDGNGDNTPGGGGASAINEDRAIGFASGPGIAGEGDGQVAFVFGEPGVGCDPTLEVAKVVSGPSTTGFTVHATCTRESQVPKSVGAAAIDTVTDVDLAYDKDGVPVAAAAPAGWSVASGTWVFADAALVDATCTATETANGGAESTTYACAWSEGVTEGDASAGCPGAASGPVAAPQSVTFVGDGDLGTLTVTNTFAAVVEPNFTG